MLELRAKRVGGDGIKASPVKLSARFGVPQRTVSDKPINTAPKVDLRFAEPIKAKINGVSSVGRWAVALLLGFNKNTVQRIFQMKSWQVCKRLAGLRPRVQALQSAATATNDRCLTDLCRISVGKSS
jgi:putative transposase